MRIFLDSADTDTIEKYWSTGLIDGITTNPSLIRKSGKNPEDVYQQLKDLGVPDLSMEVMGDADTMISEGKRLYDKFGQCTTVKVPARSPAVPPALETVSYTHLTLPTMIGV